MPTLAIIGAGAIGARHAAAAAECGYGIARVFDTDPARAAKLAEEHSGQPAEALDDVWGDKSVDAVVVGVPNKFHKPIAADAMRAAKDVLLEKPMAKSAAECDELVGLAEETGRVLQIGFAHRYTAVGAAAKKVVASGDLGQIHHAKALFYFTRGIPGLGGWFTTKEMAGGGAMIDIGVHLIDLVLHLTGQPTPEWVLGKTYSKFGPRMKDYVYESMWAGPPNFDGVCDVEDSAHAMITFAGGLTLDLNVCWAGNFPEGKLPPTQMALLGDRAGVSFELFGDALYLAGEQHGRLSETKIRLTETDHMVDQMRSFGEAVEARRLSVGATAAEGRKVQAIVDALYESSATSKPIAL
ncbi:MAG: Gfo/Idh/MocA family oxidoreductase [Planctomycetota bacterium]